MLVSRGKIYTFLNPVSYLTALKDESLFTRFDAVMVDGSILATAIRLLYNKKIKRRSFDMTSIADLLFRHILSEKKNCIFGRCTARTDRESGEHLIRTIS